MSDKLAQLSDAYRVWGQDKEVMFFLDWKNPRLKGLPSMDELYAEFQVAESWITDRKNELAEQLKQWEQAVKEVDPNPYAIVCHNVGLDTTNVLTFLNFKEARKWLLSQTYDFIQATNTGIKPHVKYGPYNGMEFTIGLLTKA